jgi:hypothetical protein
VRYWFRARNIAPENRARNIAPENRARNIAPENRSAAGGLVPSDLKVVASVDDLAVVAVEYQLLQRHCQSREAGCDGPSAG